MKTTLNFAQQIHLSLLLFIIVSCSTHEWFALNWLVLHSFLYLVKAIAKVLTKAFLFRRLWYGWFLNGKKSFFWAEQVFVPGVSPEGSEMNSARKFHAENFGVAIENQVLSPDMNAAATKNVTASKLDAFLLLDAGGEAYRTGSLSPNQGIGTDLFPLCHLALY